jgi:putative phosphoribosyl transferase
MLNQIRERLQSRQHSGRLLSEKLTPYRHDDSIVLAIPRGGIPVGNQVAASLGIPFEIIFSKRIKHPAHSDQSIGAVSLDEVVLHETQFIPQNYVLHQVNLLQRTLQEQFHLYYGTNRIKKSIKNKTVILVDDVLRETDELMACLQTIGKEEPQKIVIASAVASIKAAHFVMEEGYDFHTLFTELNHHNKAFTYFPEIDDEETKGLFESAGASITL